MRAYIDANIVLRFITNNPPEMAEEAAALFAAAEQGEIELLLDEITIAEVVWVLASYYKVGKKPIKETLQSLIAHPGIGVANQTGVLLALTLFADMNVDFADALVGVHMSQQKVADIFTYDRHFDRLPGVNCLSPGDHLAHR